MAGMPRLAQAPARSSGTQAPSRKLKADRACSSTYIRLVDSHGPRHPNLAKPGADQPNMIGRIDDVRIHRVHTRARTIRPQQAPGLSAQDLPIADLCLPPIVPTPVRTLDRKST